MHGNRAIRVADETKKTISEYLVLNPLSSENGLITVSKTKCTKDLKIVDVYFSVFKPQYSREQVLRRLNAKKKFIRRSVAHEIKLKYVPELRFFLDETLDYVDKIENLIKKINDE